MICKCSLREFVLKYPIYGIVFSEMLSDPEYIVKFKLDRKGNLLFAELGYISDKWFIDNM